MSVVNECSGGYLSEPQVAALSRTIFAHARGQQLHVFDFMSRFTLAFVQSKGMASVDEHCPLLGVSTTLEQIGKLIIRARPKPRDLGEPEAPQPCLLQRWVSVPASQHNPASSLAPPPIELGRSTSGSAAVPMPLSDRGHQSALVEAFQAFDDSGDGFLQVDEFVRHIVALPGFGDVRHDGRPLDEDGLGSIAEAIAATQSSGGGTINLLQFARAFAAVDVSGGTELADDVHEHILTFLYRHRHALRSSCVEHDEDGLGLISQREFARVLAAVNFCTSKPASHLTRAQMDALVESIAEDDGTVEYDAFLSSFEVCVV